MATSSDSSVSFEETDTRHDEMHSTIEEWIDDLVDRVDDAQASEEFQEWLDVQSRFHNYSHRNTLPHQTAVSRGNEGHGLQHVAKRLRSARPGRRTGHLDLGTNHHQAMPRV